MTPSYDYNLEAVPEEENVDSDDKAEEGDI